MYIVSHIYVYAYVFYVYSYLYIQVSLGNAYVLQDQAVGNATLHVHARSLRLGGRKGFGVCDLSATM